MNTYEEFTIQIKNNHEKGQKDEYLRRIHNSN